MVQIDAARILREPAITLEADKDQGQEITAAFQKNLKRRPSASRVGFSYPLNLTALARRARFIKLTDKPAACS